jgi:drug/metabolite transporter (DMT)-like permease
MFRSIKRKDYLKIFLRVIQALMMLGCVYTSVKYLPLVYVSLISNLGPLFTAILSYILFKKGLSKLDTMILIVSFFGVSLLITG